MSLPFSKTLQLVQCGGAGQVFTAPALYVIAVAYNGIFLRRGGGAPLYYNEAGGTITLNFQTDPGDRIHALCVF